MQVARINTSRIERSRFVTASNFNRDFGYLHNMTSFGNECRIVVINDVKNGSALIRGLFALNRIPRNIILVDALNDEYDEEDDKLTVGQGQMDSAIRYLSKYHAKEKKGKVIMLSKIKDKLMADMIAGGVVTKKTRTGKANPVVVCDPNGTNYKRYETSMYKEDIEELDDSYFVIYHDFAICRDAKLIPSTKILASGKQSKATEVELLPDYFSTPAIEAFAKLTGKKVYIFRMAQAKMAISNPNLKSITDDFTDLAEKHAANLTKVTKGPNLNPPAWLNLLTYSPLTKWIYDKFIPEPKYDEILINDFLHGLVTCRYMNKRTTDATNLYLKKRGESEREFAYKLDVFKSTNFLVYSYCDNHRYHSSIPKEAASNINELVKL